MLFRGLRVEGNQAETMFGHNVTAESHFGMGSSPSGLRPSHSAEHMPQVGGEAPVLERGVVVGKYRVQNSVALSRNSQLYRVEHHLTGASAILKIGNRGTVDRIREEASVLATLDSPLIPGLLQVGRLSERHGHDACFVMEEAPGRTLRELLRRQRRLDPVVAVRIALDVAAALHTCHQRHIVHGDVKPENIVVDDASGQIRTTLIDFGSARNERHKGTGAPATATPAYAAPEVLGGHEPTVISDVYSLASVLYETLSGAPPVPQDGSGRHIPLGDLVPSDVTLSRIVSEALREDPSRRPASVAAFAQALAAIEPGELIATGGFGGEAAPAQQDLDTLEMAEISADPPPEAMASRPWRGDHSGLLSLEHPVVWAFAGDPGTDQPQVIEALDSLSERYQVESLDAQARANKRIELLSGAPPPWVILFGDLHVLLAEPLLEEARRQGETSRLLVSTHANWDLLNTSVNACGLHAQVCLPCAQEQLVDAVEAMIVRALDLRRAYDTIRLALRDAKEDLHSLQLHSS